ncbi:uncharacterized protein LOC103714858 [Phoenix dactylifera]|uniref:Uncharacterized protein LOC103714858 n=1 Tax=Phoenix dactylifera TaxID=42345 RepID=A0A8B7CJJ1_PHODC|nr:uncharacterized protein LOC103714858 [Phoenix dactylifera]
MDLLGATLEALAFRYSAAVAGWLWAWFAVLAAALGLWRIRAALPPSPKPPGPLDPTGAEAVSAPPSAPVLIEPSPSCNADGIATPKARFMAYFHADDGSDEKERGDGISDDDGEETEKEEDAPWGWARRIVRNDGDLGLYRYENRTAFNGSVVRPWDGNVRLTVTAGRVRRRT